MPTVTNSPVLIDTVTRGRPMNNSISGSNEFGVYWGPFIISGNIYIVQQDQLGATQGQLGIFKSIDNVTFSRMDVANQPANGTFSDTRPFVGSARDGSGIIDLIYVDVGFTSYYHIEFDCSTDLYGAAEPFSPGHNADSANGYQLLRDSVGDVYFIWDDAQFATPGQEGIYYKKRTAGTWGATTKMVTVVSSSFALPLAALIDSADGVVVMYGDQPGFSGATLNGVRMSSAGVVGAPAVIESDADPFTSGYKGGNGRIVGTDAIFPYFAGTSAQVNPAMAAVASPATAPTWSTETTDPGGSTNPDYATYSEYWITSALDDAGNFVEFWNLYLNTDGSVDEIWFNTRTAGVWGTPAVFYDAIANPPPLGQPAGLSQFVHTISASDQQADGSWYFSVTLESIDAGVSACTGYLLFAVIAPVEGCPPIYVARQVQPDAPAAPPPPGIPQ